MLAIDLAAWSPDTWTAVGTWVMASVLVATLVYARGQVAEARRLRLEQTRPYVVPSIDTEQRSMFVFVLENIGRTVAHDVLVTFDEQPNTRFGDLERLRFLREPISTMPPGHRYRAHWGVTFEVLSEDSEEPKTHQVTVSYSDAQGRQLPPETYVLDFRVFEGQAVNERGLNELVKVTEELRDEIKRWSVVGHRGLAVSAWDAQRDARPFHWRTALAARQRDGWRGLVREWIKIWRNRYGLHRR